MNEYTTYKPIKGYPGYAISESGEVVSMKGRKPHTLQSFVTTSRYLCVTLSKEGSKGRGRMVTVHSLVAQAFLGDRPKGMVIDHIDGNRFNNHYSNLRYCTQKENMNNPNNKKREPYRRSGLLRPARPVIATRDGVETAFRSCQEAATQLGIHVAHVRACASGRKYHYTAHGYTFQYA